MFGKKKKQRPDNSLVIFDPDSRSEIQVGFDPRTNKIELPEHWFNRRGQLKDKYLPVWEHLVSQLMAYQQIENGLIELGKRSDGQLSLAFKFVDSVMLARHNRNQQAFDVISWQLQQNAELADGMLQLIREGYFGEIHETHDASESHSRGRSRSYGPDGQVTGQNDIVSRSSDTHDELHEIRFPEGVSLLIPSIDLEITDEPGSLEANSGFAYPGRGGEASYFQTADGFGGRASGEGAFVGGASVRVKVPGGRTTLHIGRASIRRGKE